MESLITLSFAKEVNIFQYDNIEQVEAMSGKNIRNVNSPLDLNFTDKINVCTISVNNKNGFNNIKLTYENGLLIKREDSSHDKTVFNYNYDEYLNIINVFPGFSFKDIDKNCRDRFYQNDFLGREKILVDKTCTTFVFEGKFNSKQNDLQKKRQNEYFYDGKNNLDMIVLTSYKFDGSINGKTIFQYEYIEDRLVKITETYDNTKSSIFRSLISVEYNESSNISKLVQCSNMNSSESYEIYFSNYDEFGNWHESKKYKGEVLVEQIERQIIYK